MKQGMVKAKGAFGATVKAKGAFGATGKAKGAFGAMGKGEWVWGGVGVGIAGLSACFAAYMLAFGPGDTGVASLADFGVFARMQPSARFIASRSASLLQPRAEAPVPQAPEPPPASSVASAAAAIDFVPTGSVTVSAGSSAGKAADGADAPPAPLARAQNQLSTFILRDVFNGQALVESPSAIVLVSKGSLIEGAGEVLSIERRGKQWAVVTSGGIIGSAR